MTPTVAVARAHLLHAQNRDGGWGGGSAAGSWTESTAFALLALRLSPQGDFSAARKGLDWLRKQRRQDGGCSPSPAVRESTWVTALVMLVLHRYGELARDDPAFEWLLRVEGAESSWISRLRRLLLEGNSDGIRFDGWPWIPGAAAWVAPTALTIATVQQTSVLVPHLPFAGRVESARKFLLSRRCSDGGWNHGGNRALGYESDSYPETTGMALVALSNISKEVMGQSNERAIALLRNCRTNEGWSWLQMGLRAQKVSPPTVPPPALRLRDARETAIYLLAQSVLEGHSPWSAA